MKVHEGHGERTSVSAGANVTAVSDLDFKAAAGMFPTGVVIVTGEDEQGPFGLTIQSFMSLSLSPKLVAISIATTSATLPRIQRAGRFCVNLLDASQAQLALRFAKSSRGIEKFDGVLHERNAVGGSPVFTNSLAWIECSTTKEHLEGDHVILIGEVKGIDVNVEAQRDPLIFWRSNFISATQPQFAK